jgi:hypothetical protein
MIVTKVEPVINLKGAKVLGVTLPLTPLARAGYDGSALRSLPLAVAHEAVALHEMQMLLTR